ESGGDYLSLRSQSRHRRVGSFVASFLTLAAQIALLLAAIFQGCCAVLDCLLALAMGALGGTHGLDALL
ncbi:hypothetical protein HC928_18865, partial [bacterium]|nr:hypothetical protein [bacterium]